MKSSIRTSLHLAGEKRSRFILESIPANALSEPNKIRISYEVKGEEPVLPTIPESLWPIFLDTFREMAEELGGS